MLTSRNMSDSWSYSEQSEAKQEKQPEVLNSESFVPFKPYLDRWG